MLDRIKQLAIKEEASEGTAETLTASEVMTESEELSANYTREMQERNPLRSTFSKRAHVPGKSMVEITGKVELVPGATPATDNPPAHELLEALGLQQRVLRTCDLTGAPSGSFIPGERITGDGTAEIYFVTRDGTELTYAVVSDVAADEVLTGQISGASATVDNPSGSTAIGFAYMPQSDESSLKSFTAAVYEDGRRTLGYGMRGDGSIEAAGVGEIAYLNFTLSGTGTLPTDTAQLTGVDLPDTIPETFLGANVSVDGDALCMNSLRLELGNTVAARECADAATGIRSYRITDRDPKVAIDPEQELEATHAFYGKYDAGTQFGYFSQIGTTVGSRVMIAAPRAQYDELGKGDREGIMSHDATLGLNTGEIDQGDDEFIIAFG